MEPNVALNKSKDFAIRIIKLYKYLCEEKRDYILSKQVLRSGTSIGANLVEAQYSYSRKEFLSKSYIALKECRETQYWLELLYQTDYISCLEFNSINEDCVELLKILTSITKTMKNTL